MRINPRRLPFYVTLFLFALLFGFGSVTYTGFFSVQVFLNLLIDNAFLIVVAIGMTFVILSGGIDLSVGAVVALPRLARPSAASATCCAISRSAPKRSATICWATTRKRTAGSQRRRRRSREALRC